MKEKTKTFTDALNRNKDTLKSFDGDDFRIIRSIISNYDLGQVVEVDDLIQDIFIRYYNAVDSVKVEKSGGHRSFLLTITHNYCRDIRDRESLRQHSDLANVSQNPKTTWESDSTFGVSFDVMLGGLPKKLRSVFELYWGGFRHKEIAMLLNIDENTSRKRLERSRKILKKLLK